MSNEKKLPTKVLKSLWTARWALDQAIDRGRSDVFDLIWDSVAQAKADLMTVDKFDPEKEDPVVNEKEVEMPVFAEKKGKAAVALIVGHTLAAAGAMAASPIGMQEYHYWTSQMPIHQREMEKRGIATKVFFRDQGGIAGAYREARQWLLTHDDKVCCLIEYHFNAFNKKAMGTETLHSDKTDAKGIQERVFAQMIQDAMVKAYGRTGRGNRGLKNLASRGEAGFVNLVQVVNRPSVLLEPFFGDNPDEVKLAREKELQLAQELAEAVVQFSLI